MIERKRVRRRRGFLLLMVLVIVALLSFSMYSFSETMLAEYGIVRRNIRLAQQSQIAHSGIEAARQQLSSRKPRSRHPLIGRSDLTSRRIGAVDGLAATYALVHLNDDDFQSPFPEFLPGLQNESGKLNLNSLPLALSRADEARARLTALPGVSLRAADSILDWMDEDDEPRPLGAETSFYSARGDRPRQARLHTIDELRRIRGITPELLYGEDQNRSGWMEPNENDGDLSEPPDNADGRLNLGLTRWVTVGAAESTRDPNGSPKLNVNAESLLSIYDSLVPKIGEQAALYVVAYRLEGPLQPNQTRKVDRETERRLRMDSSEARLRRQLGFGDPFESPVVGARDSVRAGLDLSRNGTFRIRSLADLIGSRVLVTIGSGDEILESPWQPDAQNVASTLPVLESLMTTVDSPVRRDRINPVAAPVEVLRTIPGSTKHRRSESFAVDSG